MIKNVHRRSRKVLIILVRFQWNLNFLDKFSKKYLKYLKIRPVGAELFHAERRTYRQIRRS